MLYILLCGVPPFWAESENGIFKAILEGPIDLSSDPWPNISDGAKDLVKKMLCKDPQKRLTAFQVLNHPWIKEDGEAPDTPLDNAVLNRLKQFRAMNQFKKAALRVIAGCLSEEEIRGLKEMFKGMDTDNSGTITLEELKKGLSEQGTKLSEYEVKQLMEAADADGDGTINYEEFITATMHLNRMDREIGFQWRTSSIFIPETRGVPDDMTTEITRTTMQGQTTEQLLQHHFTGMTWPRVRDV